MAADPSLHLNFREPRWNSPRPAHTPAAATSLLEGLEWNPGVGALRSASWPGCTPLPSEAEHGSRLHQLHTRRGQRRKGEEACPAQMTAPDQGGGFMSQGWRVGFQLRRAQHHRLQGTEPNPQSEMCPLPPSREEVFCTDLRYSGPGSGPPISYIQREKEDRRNKRKAT